MGEAEIGAVSGAVEATGHARGDDTGVLMPAHEAALRLGGAAFLTRAFHAFGSISPANSVTRITRLEPCPGGSTGHKLFLSVAYALEEPGLQTRCSCCSCRNTARRAALRSTPRN